MERHGRFCSDCRAEADANQPGSDQNFDHRETGATLKSVIFEILVTHYNYGADFAV
jgi:hypothetical protein